MLRILYIKVICGAASAFRLSRSVAGYNQRDTDVGMWNLAIQAAYVGQRTVKLISVRPLSLVNPATGTRQDSALRQINFGENAARISRPVLPVDRND